MLDSHANDCCYLKQHGQSLLSSGYPIVPIKLGEKFPKGLNNWQHTQADAQHLARWLKTPAFADGGVGVLTGRIIAVDLDIYDANLAAMLVDWCHEHIGPAPVRVGQAPKSLLVYRLPDEFPEMGKSLSAIYLDVMGENNRIEVLGKGQQFVAHAIHPGTGSPYTWDNVLEEIHANDLTAISPDKIPELFDYYHSLCRDADLERKPGSTDSIYNQVIPTGEDHITRQDSSVLPYLNAEEAEEAEALALLQTAKPRANISEERLIKLLSHIDPYDHDDWVKVGMGLYHQFDTGNADDLKKGFQLWNEWSMTADNYDPKVMTARWRSFAPRLGVDPVTLASVIRMANERVAHQVEDGEVDALTLFLERYVYVAEGDMVCDLEKAGEFSMRKLAEFKNQTANVRHLVPAPTERKPDRMILEPVNKAWLVSPDRKTADTIMYRPDSPDRFFNDDQNGTTHINSFILPEWSETHDDSLIDVPMGHFDFLFPIAEEREWFLDWMAHLVQRPWERCLVHPLLVATAHGVGRGWVTKLLTRMLGHWNMSQCKFQDLGGEKGSQYNGFLSDVLVCSIGEVKEGSERYQISDKVRDTLTEPYLLINRKYGAQGTMRVYTRFLMNSNHRDALILTDEDRRIQVLTNPDYFKPREYYDHINAWLATDGVGQFYWWLMRRDIKGFNFTRCTPTQGRANMIGAGMNEADELFMDWLKHCEFDVMTLDQVVDHVIAFSGVSRFDTPPLSKDQIRRKLADNSTNWINSEGDDRRVRWKGRRVSPLILKGDPMRSPVEVCKKLDEVDEFLEQMDD